MDNAKLDNYYKAILSKIEYGLKDKGYTVVKYRKSDTPSISVHFISDTAGKLFAVEYITTNKYGSFSNRGVVPADRGGYIDTTWAARYILQYVGG